MHYLQAKRKKKLKSRSLLLYRRFLEELVLKKAQENCQQANKKKHLATLHFIHLEPFGNGAEHGK
jgi:hypothetical protein